MTLGTAGQQPEGPNPARMGQIGDFVLLTANILEARADRFHAPKGPAGRTAMAFSTFMIFRQGPLNRPQQEGQADALRAATGQMQGI